MKNLIRLMCLSAILLTTYAIAEITIDGETIHVETNNYKVQFDYGAITYLYNKLTDETYTLPLEPVFNIHALIKGNNESFSARRAQIVEPHKINEHTAEIRFRRGGNEIRLLIAIDPNTDELLISGNCVSATPGVYAIQWGIDSLNFSNLRLILPAKSRQVIDANYAVERELFRYPSSHWEAQLAIVESELGGFYVRGTDNTFQFKELDYGRNLDNSFNLGFRTANHAPWDSLTSVESITWRFNTYAGDWCVPARIHRNWMEEAFHPWHLSDVPSWVSDIGLVISHSRLNAELLPNLAEVVDPTKTLLYLTDWRKDRHPINYPDYTPHEKFDEFLEVARQHGFRVMPHASLHDMGPNHPLYPEFQRFQYRDPWTGKLTGWLWHETDNPERNAHINPASSKWRNLIVQRLKAVWEKYNIDAFHLDTSHYVLNDGNGLIEGLSGAQGNALMHKELAQAMPGVVFGGENLHEVTFLRESFAQRGFTKGPVHPINAFLFSPYTRFYGGIKVPGTRDPRYHPFLDIAESQGHLPSLWINKTEILNEPLVRQILPDVRARQALRLTPYFSCNWGPNTLFEYTTQTGEIVTYQRTDSGTVFVPPNTDGFERVYGVTQAQTHRSLRLWRAYNETTLIGLDPNRYYILDNTPRDFSQLHISSLSPDIYINESRVTDEAVLFQLESTASERQTTVGFALPTSPIESLPNTLRPTGAGRYTLEADLSKPIVIFLGPLEQVILPYNLRDAQFNAGLQLNGIFELGSIHDSGNRRTATIDSIRKETISAYPPDHGQTVIQFPLFLPQEPSAFSFSVGLHEGCSDGVLFQVLLNGQTYFKTFKDTFDWTDGSISLSQFAGQPLLLELVTDPNGSSSCDWAHWGDLHITAAPNPDANLDGRINILDLITVAQSLGQRPPSNPLADTNKDGAVNIFDLVFVAEHLSQNAAAPSQLALIKSIPSTAKEVIAAQRALTELEAIPNKSQGVQIAIELLRHYLSVADQNVRETKLLPNYPNPFNPDTWMPYQLSEGSRITVKIYDVTGSLVRTIEVGHKPVGYYLTRERAIYWDGRNQNREPVSSGVYFYTLTAGDYTQTRRMVIVK